VLIRLTKPGALDSHVEAFARAVSSAARETDVVGWFERPAVIGMIRSFARHERVEHTSRVAAAVHEELSRWLSADELAHCEIRADVYPAVHDPMGEFLENALRPLAETRSVSRRTIKRALDIVGSACLMTAFSPAFLAIAALVKMTSRGPVLFRQSRLGRDGKPFTMLKFRTMQVNADDAIHRQYVTKFIESAQTGGAPREGQVFKIVGDPRVTSIGHFLRRSSLDELPQFWNVLMGDMSLVGPRPPLPYEVDCYKPWHRRRLTEAKPGVTGLWQVVGRSRTTFDEMVRLDLRYARTHSLGIDLKILLATPRAMVTGKGAH
jgi:lipopolysaccharide/colanic/teichoic acid biosynthesis glycosyltransferase